MCLARADRLGNHGRGTRLCWSFRKIVSPELAKYVVEKLCAGKTVEFLNRYELGQVRGGFGGDGAIKS